MVQGGHDCLIAAHGQPRHGPLSRLHGILPLDIGHAVLQQHAVEIPCQEFLRLRPRAVQAVQDNEQLGALSRGNQIVRNEIGFPLPEPSALALSAAVLEIEHRIFPVPLLPVSRRRIDIADPGPPGDAAGEVFQAHLPVGHILQEIEITVPLFFKEIHRLVRPIAHRGLGVYHVHPITKILMIVKSGGNPGHSGPEIPIFILFHGMVFIGHGAVPEPCHLHRLCLRGVEAEGHVPVLLHSHPRFLLKMPGANPFRPLVQPHLQIHRVKEDSMALQRFVSMVLHEFMHSFPSMPYPAFSHRFLWPQPLPIMSPICSMISLVKSDS